MDDLTHLSASQTQVPSSPEASILESFDSTHPERNYVIRFDCPKFTSICHIIGQPDFGKISRKFQIISLVTWSILR